MTQNPMNKLFNTLAEEHHQQQEKEEAQTMIGGIAAEYIAAGEHLVGYVLDLDYDEATLVTCDAWKAKCGGVPKNSFVIIKVGQAAKRSKLHEGRPPILILGRVTEAVATPVSQDVQRTIFQIHKVQAVTDPYTQAELQWGALKVAILGTYFDREDEVQFGNDIDSYLSPHFYEAYVPRAEHLQVLINSFVPADDRMPIGRLRFTETELVKPSHEVPVMVSPSDFVANRTALFGKTRMGKSNTIKVILDMMLNSGQQVGQVVFDLSGEYTYPDKQTGGSIYLSHRKQCTRYSVNPREVKAEKAVGAQPPSKLSANFFEQVALGHAIMMNQWDVLNNGNRPGYLQPFFGWEPVDPDEIRNITDSGDKTRAERTLSMYWALLSDAGFKVPDDRKFVELHMHAPIKTALASIEALQNTPRNQSKDDELADRQPISMAVQIYKALYNLRSNNPEDSKLFPISKRSGKPYFDGIQIAFLELMGKSGITGSKYLTPFKPFHSIEGSNVEKEIIADVMAGKTVMVDLSQTDQLVSNFYSERIAKAILREQMKNFAEMEADKFASKSVLFYFEEAHNLFRADDKDLTSIYNKLAKEGAKFRIGMIYATQSMTTLSPDLLKNTENFFIAHLNDDREIREIERRYEFKDIGLDVQRSRSKGYVRMITLSHRYALPVQIKLFEHGEAATTDAVQHAAITGDD